MPLFDQRIANVIDEEKFVNSPTDCADAGSLGTEVGGDAGDIAGIALGISCTTLGSVPQRDLPGSDKLSSEAGIF